MNSVDDVSTARARQLIKDSLEEVIASCGSTIASDHGFHLEAMVASIRAKLPWIAPCALGEAQLIHSFKVERGRNPIRFLDSDEFTVEHRRPPVRGLRRQRRWAVSQIGKLLCTVTFAPVQPATHVSINLTVAKK